MSCLKCLNPFYMIKNSIVTLWTSCTRHLIQEDICDHTSFLFPLSSSNFKGFSNVGLEAALFCITCVLWCLEFRGTLTDVFHHMCSSYKVSCLFDPNQTRTSMTGVEITGWSMSSEKKNMQDTAVICTLCLLWNLQELSKHFAVELAGALSVRVGTIQWKLVCFYPKSSFVIHLLFVLSHCQVN